MSIVAYFSPQVTASLLKRHANGKM